uniref:Uncharacterized protein n=1 Tax=uncultured Phormidium sp. TaxID=259949 RepID=W0FKG7_9CYAN|nr:hypothetical protein [uncultured Phormidium sp.]
MDAKKVATVTRNVLEITAANPRGAMRRMIRVMVPLTAAREKLRIVDARDVMYIVVFVDEANTGRDAALPRSYRFQVQSIDDPNSWPMQIRRLVFSIPSRRENGGMFFEVFPKCDRTFLSALLPSSL